MNITSASSFSLIVPSNKKWYDWSLLGILSITLINHDMGNNVEDENMGSTIYDKVIMSNRGSNIFMWDNKFIMLTIKLMFD